VEVDKLDEFRKELELRILNRRRKRLSKDTGNIKIRRIYKIVDASQKPSRKNLARIKSEIDLFSQASIYISIRPTEDIKFNYSKKIKPETDSQTQTLLAKNNELQREQGRTNVQETDLVSIKDKIKKLSLSQNNRKLVKDIERLCKEKLWNTKLNNAPKRTEFTAYCLSCKTKHSKN